MSLIVSFSKTGAEDCKRTHKVAFLLVFATVVRLELVTERESLGTVERTDILSDLIKDSHVIFFSEYYAAFTREGYAHGWWGLVITYA